METATLEYCIVRPGSMQKTVTPSEIPIHAAEQILMYINSDFKHNLVTNRRSNRRIVRLVNNPQDIKMIENTLRVIKYRR